MPLVVLIGLLAVANILLVIMLCLQQGFISELSKRVTDLEQK